MKLYHLYIRVNRAKARGFKPIYQMVIAVGVFVLSTISLGYQKVETRSDQWKQDKIMAMYRRYATEFPQVEGITVSELQQLHRQGQELILIDVRSPEERAVSLISGAITTEEFERDLQQYQDSTIIAYCTIGHRSGKYAQKMQQQGITVLNLEGSLLAWSHIQGRLINAMGVTNKVHVFGRQWQLTSENYQPVW